MTSLSAGIGVCGREGVSLALLFFGEVKNWISAVVPWRFTYIADTLVWDRQILQRGKADTQETYT